MPERAPVSVPIPSLLARASRLVGDLGHAFYFDPLTLAAGREHGLDGFRFYFLGRGGVLGDVEARVVHSAFGYFHPGLVERIWDSARQKLDPRSGGRLYVRCCQEFGRAKLSGLEGLDTFCELAGAINDAADPAGLALYAGWSAEPLAGDVAARAMQLITVLRELRGSAHLLAVVACGLRAPMAHAIRRPDDWTTFGWDGDAPVPSGQDRAALEAADALTDTLIAPAYAAVGEEGMATLVAGLEAVEAALAGS